MIKNITKLFTLLVISFFIGKGIHQYVQAQFGPPPPLLAGTTTLTNGAWNTVTFTTPFSTPPVVVTLLDESNPEPASIRVQNVTINGFEIAQVEAENDDGVTPTTQTSWIAVEPGSWTLPDGSRMEVDMIKLDNLVGNSNTWLTQNYTFGSFPSTPAIIAKIQTTNSEQSTNPGISCPWLQEGIVNVGVNSFQYAMDIAEVYTSGCTYDTELMGYIAVTPAAKGEITALDGTEYIYESILTPDSITGHGTCRYYGFQHEYATLSFGGSKNRYDGGDGGWLRYCDVFMQGIRLIIDEDQFQNTERSHTTENAGLFIIGTPAVFVEKRIARLYRRNPDTGVLETADFGPDPVSGAYYARPGDIIFYEISVQNPNGYTETIQDVYNPLALEFLATNPIGATTTPDAGSPFFVDIDSNGNDEGVLEYTVNSTFQTITAAFKVL